MGKPKFTYEFVKSFIQGKGGKLLSEEYVNCDTKMHIKCDKGHEFWMSLYCAKNMNQWCPICAGVFKPSIEALQEYAKKYNGKLLSKEYVNNRTKLTWKCKDGHVWKSSWHVVKSDNVWCPFCAKNKQYTLDYVSEFIKKRGGALLSKKYINNKHLLELTCEHGHKFQASFGDIKQGHWCGCCYGNVVPNICELREHAQKKGGKLISTEYIKSTISLEWECEYGHRWSNSWGNIKNQSNWCPTCWKLSSGPTKPQLELYDLVKKIDPKAVLEYKIKRYFLDIAIPSLKIDIEYDGSYWHNQCKEKDQKRDKFLKSKGWKVYRFVDRIPSEDELRNILEA